MNRESAGNGRPVIGHVIRFLLVWIGLQVVIGIPLLVLRDTLLIRSSTDQQIVSALAGSLAAYWATAFMMKRFEAMRLQDVGLQWTDKSRGNLRSGLALGFGAALVIFLIPLLTGSADIRQVKNSEAGVNNFVFFLAIFAIQPLGEELVVRGYPFQVLVRSFGSTTALLGSSALFALLHLSNQDVSALSTFNTFLWGLLLGAALLRSGSLWLPVGLHAGWNVALPILGMNLSGFSFRMTRFEFHFFGNPLLTGGSYGPEAGLPAAAITVILILAVRYLPIGREELKLIDAEPVAAESYPEMVPQHVG